MEEREFATGVWVLLIKPEFSVATAEAYHLYSRASPELKKGEPVKTEWGTFRNDLEPVVFRKYVLLPIIKEWLQKQPETVFALMSGSGSTLFGVVRTEQQGEALRARAKEEFGENMWSRVTAVGH
jgi:4-diphosphocytidyl-2-C-methyl-D-erythritol kinase